MRCNRVAEPQLHGPGQEAEVLDRQRLIQTERTSELLYRFGRSVLPQHERDRIAGGPQKKEEHRGNGEQDQHCVYRTCHDDMRHLYAAGSANR
jgi:hypothetical protein